MEEGICRQGGVDVAYRHIGIAIVGHWQGEGAVSLRPAKECASLGMTAVPNPPLRSVSRIPSPPGSRPLESRGTCALTASPSIRTASYYPKPLRRARYFAVFSML